MKNLLLLFLLFSNPIFGLQQADMPIVQNVYSIALEQDTLLDKIIHYGKTASVRRDSVDWKKIEAQMVQINQSEGLVEATKYMLKELKDFHGRLWYDNIPHNGYFKDWKPSTMTADPELFKQSQQFTLPIYGTTLNNKYGYIRIPGLVSGSQDSDHAHKIRQLIIDAQTKHDVEGWIIDLRLNGGGTMFPMLAGLSDFFEAGKEIGSFMDQATDYKESWLIKNHEFYLGDWQTTDYGLSKMTFDQDLSSIPVVVLISGATLSSGEVVTIAFKNRPNTFFIGEDTGGYTTTNSWRPISDNIVLQLSESYYADRLENIYKGTSIKPDKYMEGGDDFLNLEKDLKIQTAIKKIDQLKN